MHDSHDSKSTQFFSIIAIVGVFINDLDLRSSLLSKVCSLKTDRSGVRYAFGLSGDKPWGRSNINDIGRNKGAKQGEIPINLVASDDD
ncbi:MAG: hypothetical protein RIC06_01700 [Cyclobacteriaceae bacterium]